MDHEDYLQEMELQRLLGFTGLSAYRNVIDISRSKTYNYSHNNAKERIYLDYMPYNLVDTSWLADIDTDIDCDMILSMLDTRERDIMILRYWYELTDEKIARIFGCSRVRITNKRNEIIYKIRQCFGIDIDV